MRHILLGVALDKTLARQENRITGFTKIPNRLLHVVVLMVCVLLNACATQPLEPQKALEYKRIGLLSAMGDRFSLDAVGVMVFGNENRVVNLQLGGDDLLTEQFTKALSKKYSVVDLSRYRKQFMSQPKYWPGRKSPFSEDAPTVPEVVKQLMGAEGLDAYFLITPAIASVRSTNQAVEGIGIVRLGRLFRSTEHQFHAVYMVSVVDGKDFTLVAKIRAQHLDEPGPFYVGTPRWVRGPHVVVPARFFESPAEHRLEILRAFRSLMDRSIPDTLRRGNLLKQTRLARAAVEANTS